MVYPTFVEQTQKQNIMATLQAIEAINALGVSKSSLSYKSAIEAVNNLGKEIVVGKNSGSGNYASSKTWQVETVNLLKKAGVWNENCKAFNVSARGGKAGYRIIVNL